VRVPVQVITPLNDVDRAVALTNDSRYSLAGQKAVVVQSAS
jgi:acyl-CoA reductase-like NAD-dependent aldehyde dehydrogenase